MQTLTEPADTELQEDAVDAAWQRYLNDTRNTPNYDDVEPYAWARLQAALKAEA